MAYDRVFVCSKCEKEVREMRASSDWSTVCTPCQRREADVKEKQHYVELDAMTLEERIRRIEKWIYHYKPSRSRQVF